MASPLKNLVTLTVLGIVGYIAYDYYLQSTVGDTDSETDATNDATTGTLPDTLQTLYENAMNTLTGNWQSQGQGPVYMPTFLTVEANNGIPQYLLARIGYQESHFRPDIISGATVSGAGAVGIMQLLPQYFPGAGQDPQADIATAGAYLKQLYNSFGDWQVAVAAYNDGPGNMRAILAGTKTMPEETQNYISGVFADVPVQGSLIEVA